MNDGGATFYHYNATNASSQTNISLRIAYKNQIVAFGSRSGGDPLYFDRPYSFGVYAGDPYPYFLSAVSIDVYSKTNYAYLNTIYFEIPNIVDYTPDWAFYLTNGYTETFTLFGLTTTLSFYDWFDTWGTVNPGAIRLTHKGDSTCSNYIFQVEISGQTDKGYLVKTASLAPYWSRLYSLEFESLPPWRPVVLTQPHFQGEPLPAFYQGKSLQEILTNAPPVTNSVSLAQAP